MTSVFAPSPLQPLPVSLDPVRVAPVCVDPVGVDPVCVDPVCVEADPVFPIAVARYDSPLGRIEIQTRFDSIIRLDIERDGSLPLDRQAESPTPLHDEARRQLDDYFSGRRRQFDLPLEQAGTPFQEEVWARLGEVPWGTATSYGELAVLADRPLGARAIGGAIRANRIALLVPCHRVLGVGRKLTGYSPGQGVATKRWLLEHEGIDFAD